MSWRDVSPAERLLADLAKRSGVALEFPTSVNACVSLPIQPDRDLVRPAHWWYVQVLTVCRLGGWYPPRSHTTSQVRPEHPERYNPMLPETEVIAKYKRSAAEAPTAPGRGNYRRCSDTPRQVRSSPLSRRSRGAVSPWKWKAIVVPQRKYSSTELCGRRSRRCPSREKGRRSRRCPPRASSRTVQR